MSLHNDPNWPRAGHWFKAEVGLADIAIVGVGASKSAITPNNAHQTPAAIRDALLRYSTYNASRDIDLRDLKARDYGDLINPDDQERSITDLKPLFRASKTLILLGGDNSITYSGVSAFAEGSFDSVGLITLDAHHDLRDGTSNGSPVRQLVDAGLPGKNIVQVGISDFANSKFYADRARELGIRTIHRREFDKGPASAVGRAALYHLSHCQKIYLDIDIDVCDRSVVPAAPAASPGGISADQLRQLVSAIADDLRVTGFDIAEIDSSIDAPDHRTARLAALAILEIAASKAINQ